MGESKGRLGPGERISGNRRPTYGRLQRRPHGWTVAMVLTVGTLSIAAKPPDPKRVRAQPTGAATMVIDGRLDEPVWSIAPVASGFVERTPYPGRPAASRTTFRVVYDERTVYVGVEMFTDGRPPRGWERSRDNFGLFSDDAISLKFDVRLDQRTTVAFVTNPAGTQLDYVAVENGGEFRREFDAIWDVATSTSADRWTAEFAIPVIALGLPSGTGVDTVGLQVSRDHNARIATYDWTEMPPEFGPISALYYGRLEGLDGLSTGNPITLLPFVLGNVEQRPHRDGTGRDTDFEPKVGGDVRARWGQDIWTELTVLTDFAQVDLDDPVVNTNRFPLFFPERRPFFLSGVEVFGFGSQGFSQIFFSRRIGLDDGGNTVPLLAGFKSYGSQGDFRFGFLQVVTDEQTTRDGAQTVTEPGRSFTVARVRQNFGERGHIGAMATVQGRLPFLNEDDQPFEPNISLGGDGSYRAFDRRLDVSGFFAGTINRESRATRGTSGGLNVAWTGENLQPSVSVEFVSENFDPRVGFVERRDLLQSTVNLDTVFRPEGSGIQQIDLYAGARVDQQVSDLAVIGQRGAVEANIRLRNGLSMGGTFTRIEDLVREDFTLLNRVPIPADRYFGHRVTASLSLSEQRNPYFDVEFTHDTSLFGGRLNAVDATAGINLYGYGRSEVSATLSWINFNGFDTIQTTTVRSRLSITPSTKLVADLIGQANTFEQRVTALARVRWRYLPGSDLFLVYRETFPYDESEVEADRAVTLKVNYRFDALF